MDTPTPTLNETSRAVAKEAGLRYVNDTIPGFSRKLVGEKYHYFDTGNERITNEDTIQRINSLGIPPAYNNVWICPKANGHIQAIGEDERGRKQYRYHADWSAARQETKYHRMKAFGLALPKIRRRVKADLNLPGLSREKIIATIVQLLEKTLIRVGNSEYAKENKSYGLTTMRNRHVDVSKEEITFKFKGKSNKFHEITLKDKQLAKIVKKLQDLPGQELFQYLDENGERRTISSDDVNDYLQEITGQEFTAKDFRTWKGTVLAAIALKKYAPGTTKTEVKRNLNEAIKKVAAHLGNTPAVCRKAYIHPTLMKTYEEAMTLDALKGYTPKQLEQFKQLKKDEAVIMAFLETCKD